MTLLTLGGEVWGRGFQKCYGTVPFSLAGDDFVDSGCHLLLILLLIRADDYYPGDNEKKVGKRKKSRIAKLMDEAGGSRGEIVEVALFSFWWGKGMGK